MSDNNQIRTLTLPPTVLHSIQSLAIANNVNDLSSDEQLHHLLNAQVVVQQIIELENCGPELAAYKEVIRDLRVQIQ
jgi:hypothetical protein